MIFVVVVHFFVFRESTGTSGDGEWQKERERETLT